MKGKLKGAEANLIDVGVGVFASHMSTPLKATHVTEHHNGMVNAAILELPLPLLLTRYLQCGYVIFEYLQVARVDGGLFPVMGNHEPAHVAEQSPKLRESNSIFILTDVRNFLAAILKVVDIGGIRDYQHMVATNAYFNTWQHRDAREKLNGPLIVTAVE